MEPSENTVFDLLTLRNETIPQNQDIYEALFSAGSFFVFTFDFFRITVYTFLTRTIYLTLKNLRKY